MRQSIRTNIDRIILFKQTLRDVESMCKDTGGYDMKYDEFKEMCRKAWGERCNYLRMVMTKKLVVNIVYSMRSKTHTWNAFLKLQLADFLNDFFN